ncbi:general substrate transporter [Aspergillus saccharolyticus JOP 1030-1]|uniref:General substrate transporter n=1 Tax=Aspergillus saccharolyticus JOP 1030-1 TaxID=1450539 RepID=A0A318ZML0_9EURO|nr:general substrate transporter [Aspergillus saccharolyticus JOP 1030-1]PYH48726.1 general substrate transporter [Aspergillus saccharolyticus JOP 1030-1]
MKGPALRYAQIFLVSLPSFVLFGYNQSGVGGLDDFTSWIRQFPQIDTVNTTGAQESHNATGQGAVVASYTLGALIGALSCTVVGDVLGRRRTIFVGALIALIGQALECTAFALSHFVVGRVILGVGVGMLSATVPVWQSECSPAAQRGRNVVLTGMFIALGFALTQWVNFGFYHMQSASAAWRVSLAIPSVFSFVVMGSIFFLPESPRWLVMANRSDEAQRTLAALRGDDPNSLEVLAELRAFEVSLEETAAHRHSLKLRDIFTMGEEKLLYRFLLCIVLQFFQQMSGGTLISVYIPTIFETDLGLGADLSKILAACALTWKFLCCFVGFAIIDRMGRRAAFMVSGGGMSLCMLALAVSNSFANNHTASIVSAFFIFLYNLFLPVGFLGANFLYPAEVAPARLRVAMQSFAIANQWLWMFVVAMITPVAVTDIGYRYYIVYTVIAGVIPPAIYFFYPETKNRSLEELDEIFRESRSIFEVVVWSRRKPVRESVVERYIEKIEGEKAGVEEIE